MTSIKSKIVTNHGEFYRASNGDETRYYTISKKAAAIEFDAKGDPVVVMGFAVYDSTVSTIFAVGLYATFSEAEAHETIPAPVAPASVFPAAEPAASPAKPFTKRTRKRRG